MFRTQRPRLKGFTLVELLTVIAIISLLIGILLPSLSRARAQAKKVKVQTQIKAVGDGLEMFRNEHRDQYPDSTYRDDPVTNDPNVGSNNKLEGAHWLVRALVGYDLRGMDVNFNQLDGCSPAKASFCSHTGDLPKLEKLNPFIQLEAVRIVRDDDAQALKLNTANSPNTGRFVMLDDYGFPILYYRANPSGRAIGDTPANDGSSPPPYQGPKVYYQADNASFTGTSSLDGWQYKNRPHQIKEFGDLSDDPGTQPNTFLNFFHNPDVYQASKNIVPYNAESFILLSAGDDGVYGTRDDVKNFKIGL